MKRILFIFLILSFLSIGCSKEDDIQITQEVSNSLDENLFGIWIDEYEFIDAFSNSGYTYIYTYYTSFSSNGNWSSWSIETRTSNASPSLLPRVITKNEVTGTWWTQDNYLFTPEVYQYTVNNNTLTLTRDLGNSFSTLIKQ